MILYLEASFLSPEGGRYIRVGDRGQFFVSARVYLQMRCILEEKLMLPIAVNVEVNIFERVPAQLSNTQVASTYLNAPHGGSNLTAVTYT